MEQFIIERPEVSNHVSTLKADLSDMIQALSGTLGNVSIADEKEVEAAIDNEGCLFSVLLSSKMCAPKSKCDLRLMSQEKSLKSVSNLSS